MASPAIGCFVGVPILLSSGEFFGTLCAVDPTPRAITGQQVDLLVVLARIVATEIERDREAVARVRAEGALEEARQAFLAELIHDLKNPFAVIRGGAQMLQMQLRRGRVLTPDTLIARLDHLVRAAVRMTTLLDEQLDIARLRASRPLELDRAPHDLCEIVRVAVGENRAAARAERLHLDTVDPPLIAEVDAPRIGRMVDNLLSNALKFSPDDTRVTVTLGREFREDGSWASLTVSDRGIGIPAADLDHLGERYFRGQNTTGRVAGTGLGLASALAVARGHGGTLTVESTENVGTTVTVLLPLPRQVPEATSRGSTAHPPYAGDAGQSDVTAAEERPRP